MTNQTIRVLLADDHAGMRASIQRVLADESDIVIAGEAANGDEAQQLSTKLQPDVVVLDVSMPGPSATVTVAYLHAYCPATHILIFTGHREIILMLDLLDAGVSGYVLKDDAVDVLATAIRTVVAGKPWLSEVVREQIVRVGGPGHMVLTPRERMIIQMVVAEHTNKEIADALVVSEQMVGKQLTELFHKLNVKTRAGLVAQAVRSGLA